MLPVCLCIPFLVQQAALRVTPAVVTTFERDEIAGAQATLPPLAALPAEERAAGGWTEEAGRTDARFLGERYRIVVDRAATASGLCWVDADGDDVPAPEELFELAWSRLGEAVSHARVPLGELGIPAELFLLRQAGRVRLSLQTHHHLEASLEVGNERLRLIWVDLDLDGRVTAGVDRWIALPEDHLDGLSLANGLFLARETDEPWYLGALALTLAAIDAEGEVSLRLAEPAEPRHAFLAGRARRLLAEIEPWFEEDRDAFLRTHAIDPDRERAEAPPRWHYTNDFAEAVDRAAREGRPLFVEFINDACPWCKRLAWLNDRDAEVARRLAGFTLVRINVDLDLERTAERLGLRGVPKGVLFDATAEPVHVLAGWMPPAEHVAELDAAIAALEERERDPRSRKGTE